MKPQAIRTLAHSMAALTALALVVPGVLAQTGRKTFFPPGLNSTDFITNTTGTYGGIYVADTFNGTSNDPHYGTYDYCNMPHPRSSEYNMPAGHPNAKLVFLEYIQRHQRRTMYNLLPVGENQYFDCSNIDIYQYGAPSANLGDENPTPVYFDVYSDPSNPFLHGFINGSCQYPQLTVGGLLDGYQHGADLAGVYGGLLGFLPENPLEDTYFRVTNNPLTSESAGAVIRGLWPNFSGSVPLHQQPSSIDTLDSSWPCNARSELQSEYQTTALWQQHLQVSAPLLQSLSWATENQSAWTGTFDHLEDNFQSRLCNGYQLPCNPNDLSQCATMDQADEVFRAGDWEWNFYWRQNPYLQAYIQSVEGLFIGEIVARLNQVIYKNMTERYVHVFAHDGDIGPIAGALGINELRWPGMAANLAFEVWQTTAATDNLYARVLYSGQPIETIYGKLEWLPLQSLINILQPYVPRNVTQLCSTGVAST